MTMRRLVVFGAIAALVLIVAIAALFDSWQVALVALAVIQAGGVAIAVDVRAKVRSAFAVAVSRKKKQIDDTPEQTVNIRRQIDEIAEQIVSIRTQIDYVGKRTLAALESSRLEVADLDQRLSELQSRWPQEKRMMAVVQSRQIEALMQLSARVKPRAAMPPSGGWALDAINVLTVLDLIGTWRPGLVVELGSGTSSIWLGYALEQIGSGGRLVAFESDSEFAAITEAQVRKHALDKTVEIRSVPLVEANLRGHETPWYDIQAFDDIHDIGLLIVDGPPKRAGPMSRYPALPKLISRMSERVIVVLDDATRPDEEGMVRRWLTETPGFREVMSAPNDTLTVLTRMPQTR